MPALDLPDRLSWPMTVSRIASGSGHKASWRDESTFQVQLPWSSRSGSRSIPGQCMQGVDAMEQPGRWGDDQLKWL